jgi:pullulanase/glycogen debranching enzyme
VSNTYQRGDLNALDYSRAWEYSLTPKYIQQLIHLRMESPLFCLKNSPSENYIHLFNGEEKNAAAVILFNATQEMGSEQILLALNPYFEKVHFDLSALPEGKFVQIADTFSFQKEFNPPYPWQKKQLELPPLSCGIWKRIG